MLSVIFWAVRYLGPYLLIAGIAFALFYAGEQRVQRKWDIEKAHIEAQSALVLEAAERRALEAQQKSTELTVKLEKSNNEFKKKTNAVFAGNNKLLANSLRNISTGCSKGTSSSTAGITRVHSETNHPKVWMVPEEAARQINSDTKLADEINNRLQSCITFYNSQRDIINDRSAD